jgi:hypothetical protein
MRLASPIDRRRTGRPRVRGEATQLAKFTARPVAVVALLAGLSMLAAGCGGGPAHNGVASVGKAKSETTQAGAGASGSAGAAGAASSAGPSSSGPTEMQLLKYAECIRSHGVSDFPDPGPAPGGGFAFGVQPDANPRSPTPQFAAAEKACLKDVPPGLANTTPAQMAASALRYSECMRSHGEPDFPEPNAQGLIKIDPSGILSPNAPQFLQAEKDCENKNNGDFDEEFGG